MKNHKIVYANSGYMIYANLDGYEHDGSVICGITDHEGNLPKRTKESHPYSYDPICHYIHDGVESTGTMYDDRMRRWYPDKYEECVAKYCRLRTGGDASFRSANTMQNFLRDYLDDQELILTMVVEYCNPSNGYPYWRFDYHQAKK